MGGGGGVKDTLAMLSNVDALNQIMGDCQAALDRYEQRQKVQERKLGKTYPRTLEMLMNIAITFAARFKNTWGRWKYTGGHSLGMSAHFGRSMRASRCVLRSNRCCWLRTQSQRRR